LEAEEEVERLEEEHLEKELERVTAEEEQKRRKEEKAAEVMAFAKRAGELLQKQKDGAQAKKKAEAEKKRAREESVGLTVGTAPPST